MIRANLGVTTVMRACADEKGSRDLGKTLIRKLCAGIAKKKERD
jgi:hypothetical protein